MTENNGDCKHEQPSQLPQTHGIAWCERCGAVDMYANGKWELPQPPKPASTALEALPDKWRKAAAASDKTPAIYRANRLLNDCADELEAALTLPASFAMEMLVESQRAMDALTLPAGEPGMRAIYEGQFDRPKFDYVEPAQPEPTEATEGVHSATASRWDRIYGPYRPVAQPPEASPAGCTRAKRSKKGPCVPKANFPEWCETHKGGAFQPASEREGAS